MRRVRSPSLQIQAGVVRPPFATTGPQGTGAHQSAAHGPHRTPRPLLPQETIFGMLACASGTPVLFSSHHIEHAVPLEVGGWPPLLWVTDYSIGVLCAGVGTLLARASGTPALFSSHHI